MSATNATTNYALPLFIGTDKPAWIVDWNGAMTAIDAAIKGVDTDVQGAITSISGLSSTVASHTSSISTITGQITVITNNLNTAIGNINTINSLIGNGTPTTTDQTLIGAINELHADQGDLADLTTPAVSLVAAINAISGGGAVAASAVSFDNTGTSLAATDVQAAIVELSQSGAPAASAVSYDNTSSGLAATNVQDAIDEVAGELPTFGDVTSTVTINTAVITSGEVKVFRYGNMMMVTLNNARVAGNGNVVTGLPTIKSTCKGGCVNGVNHAAWLTATENATAVTVNATTAAEDYNGQIVFFV